MKIRLLYSPPPKKKSGKKERKEHLEFLSLKMFPTAQET